MPDSYHSKYTTDVASTIEKKNWFNLFSVSLFILEMGHLLYAD